MVPFLREMRELNKSIPVGRWVRLAEDVIRLKHQECEHYDTCTCLHRLPY